MEEKILQIGVGGEGCRMMERASKGPPFQDRVAFLAIDTDREALENAFCDQKLLIGEKTCMGKGTAGGAEKGAKAVEESKDDIVKALKGYEKVDIYAGTTGGTGTGAGFDIKILDGLFESARRDQGTSKQVSKIKESDINFDLIRKWEKEWNEGKHD